LKRKCISLFSRKCENHAKIGRFLRNFTKFHKIFCFCKNFRENETQIFEKIFTKISYIFAKIFAKTKNADFSENFRENFAKIFTKRKTQISAKIFVKISYIFYEKFWRKRKTPMLLYVIFTKKFVKTKISCSKLFPSFLFYSKKTDILPRKYPKLYFYLRWRFL
jgi:hypothetical protein